MAKQDFLTELQRALSGRVSSGIIRENVRYYDDYISMRVRKGEAEEDVLQELGSPRLLARTIEAAHAGNAEEPGKQKTNREHTLQIPAGLAAVIVGAAAFLVILLAAAAAYWLLPLLVPAGIVWALMRRRRERKGRRE